MLVINGDKFLRGVEEDSFTAFSKQHRYVEDFFYNTLVPNNSILLLNFIKR